MADGAKSVFTEEDVRVINHNSRSSGSDDVPSSKSDPELIRFDEEDGEKPQNWPWTRRWLIIIAASLMTMISVVATTLIAPTTPQIVQDLHVQDDLYRTLLVSIWDLGEGIGPFLAAPLSERYGRLPILHISNLLGLICIIACALSVNISMLVAFRFLGACMLNAPTLGPAIIGDVTKTEERGRAMATGMGVQILAPFVAPISGAYINQALGWRWTQWVLVIEIAVCAGVAFIVMRETYPVTILERKAARLRRTTGNARLRSLHRPRIDAATLWSAMTEPLQILFQSPAVLLVSIYTGLVCGMLFLVTTTLTPVMEDTYNFSLGAVGLTYTASCVGFVLAMVFYGLTSDRYLRYKKAQNSGVSKPEHRLVHMLLGSLVLPIGFLLYGWTSAHHVHYIAPLIGTTIIGFSLVLAILPSQNYLVDAYEVHSASAIAACLVLRALFGAAFPLVGPPLYRKFGLGWGNSLLALISAVFIPPIVLLLTHRERFKKWRRE